MLIELTNQSGARAYATDNKPSGQEDGNPAQSLGLAGANSLPRQSTPRFLRTPSQNEGVSYYNANAVSNYSWRINPGGGCPSAFEMSQNVLARTDRNYSPEMAGFVALLKADEKARWEADEKARGEADEKARGEADEKARGEADQKQMQGYDGQAKESLQPDGKCCRIC